MGLNSTEKEPKTRWNGTRQGSKTEKNSKKDEVARDRTLKLHWIAWVRTPKRHVIACNRTIFIWFCSGRSIPRYHSWKYHRKDGMGWDGATYLMCWLGQNRAGQAWVGRNQMVAKTCHVNLYLTTYQRLRNGDLLHGGSNSCPTRLSTLASSAMQVAW